MNKQENLQNILDDAVDNKKIFGTSFCIKHKNDFWCGSSGNLDNDSQFFITSATKIFISAIILNFKYHELLDLNDKISKFLSENTLKDLLVINGVDHSNQITIRDLLAHTSGLPDYLHYRIGNEKTIFEQIREGIDRFWIYDTALEWSKTIKPNFSPGSAKGKAQYSDTNFQLLGRIIENITNRSLSENYDNLIFKPSGLIKTYMYRDINDRKPKCFYNGDKELFIPKAMASFGPDGGIVTSSNELLVFIENFFNGAFFPRTWIEDLKVWNKIYLGGYYPSTLFEDIKVWKNTFSPVKVGTGIERFKMPWFLDLRQKFPELYGYIGISGSLVFHSPEKELYIAGTVNQVAYPGKSFEVAIKLIKETLNTVK